MTVSFYTSQPKETILTTESWAQMYVGFQFEHNSKTYGVDRLQWLDREKGTIKAFCSELPVFRHEPNNSELETQNS